MFETFLESNISNDDNRINIVEYSLLRADHPSNTKKGGVCIYYKDFLPLLKKDDITDLKEVLLTEITVDNEKCFFKCLYRSPSQNCDQFSDFCKDFSILLNNINDHRPSSSFIVGDFNAKYSKWYSLDKNNAALEARQTYTTTAGSSQLIDQPTHCVNGSSSRIDLIFTFNTNLVTDFGVDPALYKTCNYNLIFGKINFINPVPPPFYRDIWDYKSANVEMIQKAIADFNWKRAFSNNLVNENTCFTYPIEVKIYYRKPKWITPKILAALKKRSKLSKKYYANPTMITKEELNSYSKY